MRNLPKVEQKSSKTPRNFAGHPEKFSPRERTAIIAHPSSTKGVCLLAAGLLCALPSLSQQEESNLRQNPQGLHLLPSTSAISAQVQTAITVNNYCSSSRVMTPWAV